jgi:hypothetical protein
VTPNRGLGNRLFKICATLSHAIDHSDEAVFPDLKGDSHADTIFRNLPLGEDKSFVTSRYKWFKPGYKEVPYNIGMELVGDFQSYKYFKKNESNILHLFKPSYRTIEYLREKYAILTKLQTVSIHVRRGDYVNHPDSYLPTTLEYVQKARSLFDDMHTFVYFSDDIEWCRENMTISDKDVFIEGETDVMDLYLMSMMSHNIITNSTFSWWAAYLNQNAKKIIVSPEIWYGPTMSDWHTKDLIPPEWIVLSN